MELAGASTVYHRVAHVIYRSLISAVDSIDATPAVKPKDIIVVGLSSTTVIFSVHHTTITSLDTDMTATILSYQQHM